MVETDAPSSYLQYLPRIYQESAEKGAFIGRFLKIFEKILSGIDDDENTGQEHGQRIEGVERIVSRLHEVFNPLTAPESFLEWIAGWMALVLRNDWSPENKRRLIRRIIPLYGRRGTRTGLAEYLKLFVAGDVRLEEYLSGISVGGASSVGRDTFIGGLPPFFFIVTIVFEQISSLGVLRNTVANVKSILDLEKPAHTYYALRFDIPGIAVGVRATVGADTILGKDHPFFV